MNAGETALVSASPLVGTARRGGVSGKVAVLPNRRGGRLCLDFVNTVDPRHSELRREYLLDFDTLIAWAVQGKALPKGWRSQLQALGASDPEAAVAALATAKQFREDLHRVLTRPRVGKSSGKNRLARVNAVVQIAQAKRVLVATRSGFIAVWPDDPTLESILWPIALDAFEVLTSPEDMARLRECPGHDGQCGWLFIDESRRGNRRWCEMQTCGSRAKAKAYYARLHAEVLAEPELAAAPESAEDDEPS